MEKTKKAKASKENDFTNDRLSDIDPLDEDCGNEEYYKEEDDTHPKTTENIFFHHGKMMLLNIFVMSWILLICLCQNLTYWGR